MHLFIDTLMWKKKKLHISYTNFIFEVINIKFWQIRHFDGQDTGWVGLQLRIILMQTVGRFDMWVVFMPK